MEGRERERGAEKKTHLLSLSLSVCPQLLATLNYCLPSTVFASHTVCPRLLFAFNYCLPSTAVCPRLLFALNCCLPLLLFALNY